MIAFSVRSDKSYFQLMKPVLIIMRICFRCHSSSRQHCLSITKAQFSLLETMPKTTSLLKKERLTEIRHCSEARYCAGSCFPHVVLYRDLACLPTLPTMDGVHCYPNRNSRLLARVKNIPQDCLRGRKKNIAFLCSHVSFGDIRSAPAMFSNPAGERNKEHILGVLKKYLAADRKLAAFEVASGPGTHVCLFAKHFPLATWQPSDIDPQSLHSIEVGVQQHGLTNVLAPLSIDVSRPLSEWASPSLSPGALDVIVCINMIHISPWPATEGLFSAAGQLLKPGGYLFTYGPYMVDGKITPESNVNFNESLKTRNPNWGLRDINVLRKLAEDNGLHLVDIHDMPANNKTLVFQKTAE